MITNPICGRCKHLSKEVGFGQKAFMCPAYPEGIPDDILNGVDLHERLRGDEAAKVHFESWPGAEPQQVGSKRAKLRFFSLDTTDEEIDAILRQQLGRR